MALQNKIMLLKHAMPERLIKPPDISKLIAFLTVLKESAERFSVGFLQLVSSQLRVVHIKSTTFHM
jgi:hypothetical protein